MKPVDSRNKGDASVENILQEIKNKGGAQATAGTGRHVDDILADMGLGDKKAPIYDPNSPNFRAQGKPQPALSRTQKIEQSTAVFKAITKQQVSENAAQAVPQAKAPATSTAQPQPQAKAAPAPAAQQAPAPPKKDFGKTTIWDVQVERDPEEQLPRVGKAAALDKVDREKFSRDEELLSWFSGTGQEPLSKKEQRQLAKEEKRQEAMARRAAKQQTPESEPEPIPAEVFQLEEDPEQEGFFVHDEPEEAPQQAPPEKKRSLFKSSRLPADDVVTGSAFDAPTGVDEWPEEGSLFDNAEEFYLKEPAPASKTAQEPASNTQSYEITEAGGEYHRVPTAAFTQEFETEETTGGREGTKSLFVDEMVDDRFREFFGETVIVEREDLERATKTKIKKPKKRKTPLLTGEFSKLAMAAEAYPSEEPDEDDFADYNQPQDAEAIEEDLASLKKTLLIRSCVTAGLSLLLFWMAFGLKGALPLPGFINPALKPLWFGLVYLVLLLAAVIVNFTTVAAGLTGLGPEPSSDSGPALAAVGALLQSVVVLVQLAAGGPLETTLFGGIAALLLTFNAFGKGVRARSILHNFQLASAEFNHSAAYVLDDNRGQAYDLTHGLREDAPTVLVSRPTALVKGFMRQSFSLRWSDRMGRILGWVLLGVGLFAGLVSFVQSKEIYLAISSFAAALCIGAPLSSTLLAAVPSALLQQSTAKVGAVVPGWSAIEELGEVNVVMAGARDLFPPTSVKLNGIKTFAKERIDLALLYASSVLIAGCDTLKDIFMGVIQGKSDMLYKVESLQYEPGRGFTAWVNNSRVVIGTREMLQRHDVDPPSIEIEMNSVPDGCMPVYLAVGGKLTAMFVISYQPDEEVDETLDGLVKSGVSLLVTSQDMNITGNLIERIYQLPPGTVKVLGERELEIMEPLTEYLPESEGVMTHIGSFASFIGGMRAAAGCAAAERMAGILQIAAVGLAGILCLLLAISGGLAGLSLLPVIIYQLAWTLMVVAVPFMRRY
ncbi:hypothetical protein LJC61_05430 [Ruminococcaceae bacterium OttesenSCG-928-A16]|nr:hypothetical protein [Ruminococcaceae bacterium OttesenSCG-928-A16]